ncbi:MAG: SprB repeat-containing protein, partial [Cyclobacteriaceae bacterium]
ICTNSFTGGLRFSSPVTSYPDVKINVSGSVSTSIFPVSSSSLNGYLLNLAPGTYNIQLVNYSAGNPDVEQCFSSYGPFTVGNTNTPISLVGVVSSDFNGRAVSCNGFSDGQVTLTPSGGTAPFSYSRDGTNFQVGAVFSGLGAGTHTFTLRDVNGCIATTDVVLAPTPDIVLGSLTPTSYGGFGIRCAGESNGGITFSATGGTGALSYAWRNSANTVVSTSASLSSVPADSYTVTVTDVNGCSKSSSGVALLAPPPMAAGTSTKTDPLCSGGLGTIIVSGASSSVVGALAYSVNGTDFQSSPTFTNKPAGSYTVYVRDANSCIVTQPSQVTIAAPPAIGIVNAIVNTSCFAGNDGRITVTATNGVSPLEYRYTRNSTTVAYQTSNVFNTGIVAGTYTIEVRDASGCTNTSTAIVSQPFPVDGAIGALPTFSCFNPGNGGTINLTPSGGTPPFSYSWRDNTTNAVIATTQDASFTLGSLLSNTYTVTITDSRGCVGSRTTPVIIQPAQLVSTAIKTDVTCFGASNGSVNLTVTGGTSPYLYSWSNGATTEDLISRPPGLYSVTVTDANGCTTNTSATIIQPAQLTLSQGTSSHVLCNGQANGSVTLNATGGTGVYEYSRDGITWQPSSTISSLNATSHTLRVRDQNLCINQIIVTITQPPVLTASVGSIQGATCGQSNGSASSLANGGTGTYSFAWRNGLNQVVSTAPTLVNVPGGTYSVTVTDQNGCTDFEDAAIPSPDGPQATINSTTPTRCSDSNDGRATITVSQGQAPYTIVWNNGETGLNPVALRPGIGINIVTITDATGCITSQVVNVPSPPTLEATPPVIQQATCPAGTNGSIQTLGAGGTAPYTYAWNTGATTSLLNNIGAGTYSLTIRDANNCTITESITLSDKPAITVQTVSEVAPACAGRSDGSISVNAMGGNGTFSYAWNTGATGSTLASIGAGTYTVTATDVLGCTSQRTFVFADPPPLSLDLGPDRKICVGGILTIASPENAASYVWSSSNGFSSTLKQVTLTQAGDYTLRIVNANGCLAEDTFTLTTATDLLSADFLMIPQAEAGDTIIVIDISWPVPEGIVWTLPSEASVIERTPDYVTMVFDEPGIYEVILTASLAQCQDDYRGTIDIRKRAKKSGGRLSTQSEPLIRSVTAFPVPTKDRISGMIELSQESAVTIRLVSPERNLVIRMIEGFGRSVYEFDFEVSNLPRGVYFLIFESGREAKVIRVAVI